MAFTQERERVLGGRGLAFRRKWKKVCRYSDRFGHLSGLRARVRLTRPNECSAIEV